jgi:cell division protease FtsH
MFFIKFKAQEDLYQNSIENNLLNLKDIIIEYNYDNDYNFNKNLSEYIEKIEKQCDTDQKKILYTKTLQYMKKYLYNEKFFLVKNNDNSIYEKVDINPYQQYKIDKASEIFEEKIKNMCEKNSAVAKELGFRLLDKIHKYSFWDKAYYYLTNNIWYLLGGYYLTKNTIETQFNPIKPDKSINFKKVGGFTGIKKALNSIIDQLKNPKKYEQAHIRMPRGMILYGPPGTGKTYIAKAIASEAEVPIFVISYSDLVNMYLGQTEKNIHNLFSEARRVGPCIIFLDELDAIAPSRDSAHIGGNYMAKGPINVLLQEIDGFVGTKNIFIIGATNKIEVIDSALKRSGRLEMQFYVGVPSYASRRDIIKVQLEIKKLVLDKKCSIDDITSKTSGFSAADIESLINKSGMRAFTKHGNNIITWEIVDEGYKEIAFGLENDIQTSENDLLITSYHEIGHLICSILSENPHIIEDITIVSRGKALGMNHFITDGDISGYSKEHLKGLIVTALGGMMAEKIFTKTTSTGVSSDLEYAKKIAESMIIQYGMGEKIISSTNKQNEQIETMMDECEKKAYDIIEKNRFLIEDLAQVLLEKKTMSRQDILEFLLKKKFTIPEKYSQYIKKLIQ